MYWNLIIKLFVLVKHDNKLLFIVCTNKYTYDVYNKISNYITNAPTCFGASALSSGSFDIAFAKVIKY
jgi:hypothetical protein